MHERAPSSVSQRYRPGLGRCGLVLPDILRVAAAYGIRTAHVANHRLLSEALEDVLSGGDPVICTVASDESEVPEPRVTSRVLPDGSMESRSIEDLSPLLTPEELAEALKT